MSEQQRKMLATLKRMKFLCAIGVIANVLLHPDVPFLGIRFSIAQTILILIWLYGLINGLGYLNQNVPLFQIGIVRGGQIAYLLLRHFTVSLPSAVILIAMDVIWVVYLLSHKAKYYYERV